MESAMFEVAIGLMFIYLVLSLVVTAVNELIAQVTSLRARTLAKALPQIVDNAALLGNVLNHGMVNGGASVSKGKAVNPGVTTIGASYLPSKNFATAVLASLDPNSPVPGIAAVSQAVNNLPDSNIRDVLQSALAHAGGDIARARDNIATWFDGSMDRLSGVYKRHMQCIGFVLAVLIAFGLNLDSIRLGNAIWADTSLRSAVSQAALRITAGGDNNKVACDAAPKYADIVIDQSPAERAVDCLRQLESVRDFPIGWEPGRFTQHAITRHVELFGWTGLLTKLFGLIMTVFAISLGAPFWFDMLSKFVRVSATGVEPKPAAPPS
jgi:hypothetical protein